MLLWFNHCKWSLSHTLKTLDWYDWLLAPAFTVAHRLVMLHHHASSPFIYYKPASLSSDHSVFVVSFLVSARCLVCDCFRKPPLTHWPPAALCPGLQQQWPPGPAHHSSSRPGSVNTVYHISSPWLAEPPPVRPSLVRALLLAAAGLAVLCISHTMFDSDYNCRVYKYGSESFKFKRR